MKFILDNPLLAPLVLYRVIANSFFFLLLLCPHQESSALQTAAKALDILFNAELIFVPLVVHGELLAWTDLTGRKEADVVQGLRLELAAEVKALHVRIAAVVDEATFISVEEAVEAEGEELVVVG